MKSISFLLFVQCYTIVCYADTIGKLPKMDLPEGWTAEVAAAPPLVKHPMMASFDDRGRLFVAESAGLNLRPAELEKELPNKVLMLEDTNNDGIFDKSTVFADKMTFPQGACWHDGALYVASPPGIWKLVDTDEDGVADEREMLVSGFKYTGNAADVHGPFLHPNGRLYWCHGRKGHEVYQKDGTLVSKGKGARIWSMLPDGLDIRVHAGGGMDNPVELDFTPEGEIWGSVNLFYGRPRGDVLVNFQEGGVYPRLDQGAVLEEFKKTGPPLREAFNFGHIAVSGMCIVKGENRILTSSFNTQEIFDTRFDKNWENPVNQTFMKVDDPDVHFTDVLQDADGSFLVVDTGGWFRIGCPTSQIAKPEIPGAIYRIRKAGIPDRRTDFRGNQIQWSNLELKELGNLLGDEREAVQKRAINELVKRGDSAYPILEESIGSLLFERKIRNSIWALARIGRLKAKPILKLSMQWGPGDSVQGTVANAISSSHLDIPFTKELLYRFKDHGSTTARRSAFAALGRMGDSKCIEKIIESLKSKELDRMTEHAAIYGLIQIDDFESTWEHVKCEEDPLLFSRALWALDQMESSQLKGEQVLQMLTKSSTSKVTEVVSEIAKGHPEWAKEFADYFARKMEKGWLQSDRMLMEAVFPNMIGEPAIQSLLDKLLQKSQTANSAFRIIAASSEKIEAPKAWKAPFEQALRKANPEALRAASQLKTNEFNDTAKELARNQKLPNSTRLAAMELLSQENKIQEEHFAFLLSLLNDNGSISDRVEGIGLLTKLRLTSDQLIQLAKVLIQVNAEDFRSLLQVFSKSRNPDVGKALAKAIETSPSAIYINVAELRRALNRYPAQSTQVARSKLKELELSEQKRDQRLETLGPLVSSRGNASRGHKLFMSGVGACSTCHKIGDTGRDFGPDLTKIGRIRQPRDLLESILSPGASLARDFETWNVKMKNGSQYLGLIRKETPLILQLAVASGADLPLPRNKIQAMVPAPFSLMPQGLDATMTEQQLLDLVAYLMSLK